MMTADDQKNLVLRRILRFLGSVQLAVPVLIFVAIAMAWGTYLESTQNSTVSRATVYGSWWFMALMVLICVSLIFAVVNRYPWKRKHVGFITVHAGLVLLIGGSFWSLVGRIEGHLTLEEGTAGDQIETDKEVLELAEFNAGVSSVVGTAPAPMGETSLKLGPLDVRVVERWDNCQEVNYVANDAPDTLRAFEISGNPTASEGDWVADEAKAGGAPTLEGMVLRVLPDGADWTPPAAPAKSSTGFVLIMGDKQFPVGEVGSETVPGWKVVSINKYANATVANGQLSDGGPEKNPAVEVTVSNGQGSVERHTWFEKFPDMVLAKTIEGTAKTEARLTASAAARRVETLVMYGPIAAPKFGYIGLDGGGRVLTTPPTLPCVIEVGSHKVRVLRQYSNARAAVRFEKAPTATERRPALVLKLGGQDETLVLAWKQFEPLKGMGGNKLLRFGPQMVRLPFSVKLNDFRKTDYPGTEMAMSYESDVVITTPGVGDQPYLIHMNTPYAHSPWKVYQSGFLSEKVSVFSVMRDPGLPLTYAGSIVLCLGIFATFFVRPLSAGHPGIPAPTLLPERESQHVQSAPTAGSAAAAPAPDAHGDAVCAGG